MPSTAPCGAGILTCCPSTTLFSLVLGPTNPGRIYLPQETLGFRRAGFSPALSLLIPAFSLATAPALLTVRLRRGLRRSSTDGRAGKLLVVSCQLSVNTHAFAFAFTGYSQ